jgi:hypothetical protein
MPLMRLLTGLPFAPLKGLVALARQLEQEAGRERERERARLQAELLELEVRCDRGELERKDLDQKEAELLRSLGVLAGVGAGGDPDGP